MATHTPGPWQLHNAQYPAQPAVRARTGDLVAKLNNGLSDPLVQANARLIAAAPDLLAALKEVRGCPQAAPWLVRTGAWDLLNAAIAKAEGT